MMSDTEIQNKLQREWDKHTGLSYVVKRTTPSVDEITDLRQSTNIMNFDLSVAVDLLTEVVRGYTWQAESRAHIEIDLSTLEEIKAFLDQAG